MQMTLSDLDIERYSGRDIGLHHTLTVYFDSKQLQLKFNSFLVAGSLESTY